LEFSEISVDESYFDRGCAVAEAWEAARETDVEKHSRRYCLKCGSQRLEYTGADSFSVSVWRGGAGIVKIYLLRTKLPPTGRQNLSLVAIVCIAKAFVHME